MYHQLNHAQIDGDCDDGILEGLYCGVLQRKHSWLLVAVPALYKIDYHSHPLTLFENVNEIVYGHEVMYRG